MDNIQVIIDYLTMTSKVHSFPQIIEILGLVDVPFEPIKSFLGYENCLYYEGIRIHWTENEHLSEICIDLSGKGCRTVESVNREKSFDWLAFFTYFEDDFKTGDCHISRLDVAADDFKGILNFSTLTGHTMAQKYISRAKREPWWTQGSKLEIYFGSEKSNRLLRIYDKKLEQKRKDIPHWIRCEMQLRNECALSFLLNFYKQSDIGKCYSGVLLDYLRFHNSTEYRFRTQFSQVKNGWILARLCGRCEAHKTMLFARSGHDALPV